MYSARAVRGSEYNCKYSLSIAQTEAARFLYHCRSHIQYATLQLKDVLRANRTLTPRLICKGASFPCLLVVLYIESPSLCSEAIKSQEQRERERINVSRLLGVWERSWEVSQSRTGQWKARKYSCYTYILIRLPWVSVTGRWSPKIPRFLPLAVPLCTPNTSNCNSNTVPSLCHKTPCIIAST